MFLHDELVKRAVPMVLTAANGDAVAADSWEIRRRELIEILSREEYGYMPPSAPVSYDIVAHNSGEYAGKAEYSLINLKIETPEGIFSFPLNVFIPHSEKKLPLILHINFRPDIPDKYMPVEEIIDNGFALASFCYTDVAADADDGFRDGIAAYYDRKVYNWGKIGMWAWAASRALDYLCGLDDIDGTNIAVIGHSRLGKTALWCGANDTRVKFTISNDSGCSGGAITRGKTGERVAAITKNFPFWFCPEYKKYIDKESEMPFDQNFLIAACAPRRVLIGTAAEDSWADPFSEYLACYSASEAWSLLGRDGLIGEDRAPEIGDTFDGGEIGFHLRAGTHFLSRTDWIAYMTYIKRRLS